MWDRITQDILHDNFMFINSEHLNLDFQKSKQSWHCLTKC